MADVYELAELRARQAMLAADDVALARDLRRRTEQLLAAYDALEAEHARKPLGTTSATIGQAGVTVGIAWEFTQKMVADVVPAARYPGLAAFAEKAEALPEFRAAPHGDGTYGAA